jgi:hypothetical protein
LVRYKYYSPFAATIAGSILVRARQWDKLKDWLRNLANIEPYVPDAQVLWVEQCLRQPGVTASLDESLEYFLRLRGLPLPYLAETLGRALQQAEDLLTGTNLEHADKSTIQEIRARLQLAVSSFRTGGMFATFAGPKGKVEPDIVMPAKIQSELAAEEVEAQLSDFEQAVEQTATDVEDHSEPDSEERKGYA